MERLGDPIGKQDQYAAAYGGMNLFLFRRDGTVAVERIPLAERDRNRLDDRLMMFYTGITRSAGDILTEQRANTASSADKFANLRRMRDMALELKGELHAGRVEAVGEFLRRGWEMKRTLAGKISNERIDDMYDRAMRAGAAGGKLLGAGGGGFLLFYCEPERQEAVKMALSELRHVPFRMEGQGSRVLFFQGG
jgi:D-glycero-alpha-D-manno-heptose-7-phosphate kinase